MTDRVRRWGVPLAGTVTLLSVGLLAAEPALFAGAAIPLAYVLVGALSRVPSGANLDADRTVAAAAPTPGDPVDVTLTVENTGRRTLTDVRIVDGVPAELTVVSGSPRACRSLRPGESTTVEYAVRSKRGTYAFDDPVVRIRPLAATEIATATVAAAGDTALTCANVVAEAPLADATLPRAGTLPTDSGGSGLEFHATRDYQSGDPVSRIDWRRFAKTGELTTVEYREEQAVRTVLVVDARPPTRVTPEAGYPTGAELAAYAAERLLDALARSSVVASITAVGLADEDLVGGLGPDGLAWADPDGGVESPQASRLFDGVQSAATRDSVAPDGGEQARAETATDRTAPDVETLLARLPPTAQVVVFSPLLDDWPTELITSLRARNYPTTVVSPDVTRGEGPAQTVVALERRLRLQSVELSGATLIDWDLDEPIDIAMRASLAELFNR
ncbi:DUF58 domain-containing protein [Halomicrobium sp. IBSBa]|uniref:DUF58 domain-containing protein n=1 Tax=Halomicrobium sp. IBSBa TaxID=2778916 RepID=UPI001ABF3D79|nr:DUF58 domain-containing protein [Halomicrobium sp. IBSBa]MBO4247901.1 DUF58 domain-containing protein [Halomicrobium sp. IBSBa]